MFKYDMLMALAHVKMLISHVLYSMFLIFERTSRSKSCIDFVAFMVRHAIRTYGFPFVLYANSHTRHSRNNMRAQTSKRENVSLTVEILTSLIFYVFEMLLW